MTILFRTRLFTLTIASLIFAWGNVGPQRLHAQTSQTRSAQEKSPDTKKESGSKEAPETKEEATGENEARAEEGASDKKQQEEKAYRQIEFESGDGVIITADLYMKYPEKDTPLIVLCHMAGSSRGEYREIAPRMNELGFNCIAIDQRSGGNRFVARNMTSRAAAKARETRTFVDAEQDMVAAIDHVKENYANGKVILWGSSYSAGLTIRIAGEQPEKVDGVLAFSPNEYFTMFGKPNDWVRTSAAKINSPAFLTSAKFEGVAWQPIFDAIPGDDKVKFLPKSGGNHGSVALMELTKENPEYWKAVEQFLKRFQEDQE